MSAEAMVGAVGAASLAELSWVGGDGPQVRGVVPLLRGERPTLAFTYADEEVARAVAAAPMVTLSLTEQRSTGRGFRPLVLTGRPVLTEDPEGELYGADLLVQELRRYPPSRVYADSPLLQREHWWYLPRLIVEIDVEAMQRLSPRTSSEDHVLVVADGQRPLVQVARVLQPHSVLGGMTSGGTRSGGTRSGGPVRVELELASAPPPGPAVLFGQEASFPDLERWSQWRYRGHWDGATLAVDEAPARTGLAPPPGLLQRWRRQRDLERRCVAAIPRR